MLKRELDNWINPQESRGLLYFAERILEMTFPYTQGSHRAPLMTPPTLILECLELIELSEINGRGLNSVKHAIDELEIRMRGNIIVSSLITIKIDKHFQFDRSNAADTRRALQVMYGDVSVHSYPVKCFEMLSKLCSSNRRKDIDYVTRELVSILNFMGVSSRHINSEAQASFFGTDSVDGVACLPGFFKRIFPHYHNFKVMGLIRSPLFNKDFSVGHFFPVESRKDIAEDFLKYSINYKKLKRNEMYFLVDVEACDKYSAIEHAKRKIQRYHDIFGMYHHKDTFEIHDYAYALQKCCDDVVHIVPTSVNMMRFTNDKTPSDAQDRMLNSITDLKLLQGEDREKFFSIVSFHGMSLNSLSSEAQYTQIWTAMETMCSGDASKSIIDSVSRRCVPVLSLNYSRELFKSVMFDLIRWNKKVFYSIMDKCDHAEDNNLIEKTFNIICLECNEERLEELFSEIGSFELLRYRIFRMREIFSNPKEIVKCISSHSQRIEWQLHRIYRKRNAIVHSGEEIQNAGGLFVNAHEYFDEVFDTCCSLCKGTRGYSSFDDAFNYMSKYYGQYIDDLNEMSVIDKGSAAKIIWEPPKSLNHKVWVS